MNDIKVTSISKRQLRRQIKNETDPVNRIFFETCTNGKKRATYNPEKNKFVIVSSEIFTRLKEKAHSLLKKFNLIKK